MTEPLNPTTDKVFKKYIPVVTAICCVISIALFTGINLEGEVNSWDVYKKWGAPSPTDLYNGHFWGLITSNFLHVEIWHIAFNLYWLWILGKKIEFESNKGFYILLIISAALVSSLAELAFSDTTGIGLSGIGYALFGYLFVKSKTTAEYRNYLEKKTIYLFLIWLVVCVVLTKTGAWNVGNAAHFGGLFWGALVAYTSKYNKYLRWIIGLGFITALTALIFFSPFSTFYLSNKAYELHKDEKLEEAMVLYRKILKIDPDSEFAKTNLKQIEIHQLQEKDPEIYCW